MNEYDQLIESDAKPVNEYDNLVPGQSDTRSELQQSMFVAAKAEPDQKAERVRLADEMNLPVAFVERNYDKIVEKRQYAKSGNEYDDLIGKNPKLAEFLKDPDNASVAKDDLDKLSGFEKVSDRHGYWDQAYNSLMSGVAKSNAMLAKTPAYIGNLSLTGSNLVRKALDMPEVGYQIENDISKKYDAASQFYSSQAPASHKSAFEEISKGNYLDAAESLSLQVIGNAPQQLTFIASALAGMPAVGLAQAGLTTAAEKAGELQAEGVGTLQATSVAAVHGSIEAAFESLGTLGVLKTWENAIAKQYGKQVSKEVMFNFSKTLAHSVMAEGNEEALTSLAQDFTDYATGVNPEAMKGSVQRMVDAGLVGGMSGGTMTSPSAMAAYHAQQSQVKQAKLNKDTFMAMGESAKESKLRERLPERYRQFVDQVTKDGPVSEVYIPIEGMEVYFQNKNINPTQAAQEMGILNEYNEAKETGADIKVPMSTMIDKVVDTEHFAGLSNDIKYKPDQQTVNEAKAEGERIKEDFENVERQSIQINDPETEVNLIGQDVTKQLMKTGMKQKDALIQAKIHTAFFSTMSEKMNISPGELYKKYGLRIRNEGQLAMPDETVLSQTKNGLFFVPIPNEDKSFNIGHQGEKTNATVRIQKGKTGNVLTIDNFKMDSNVLAEDILATVDNMAANNFASAITISPEALFENEETNQNVAEVTKKFTDAGFKPVKLKGGKVVLQKKVEQKTYKQDKLGFFSQVSKEVEKMDFANVPAKDLAGRIKNIQGVKAEELETLGLLDWLNGKEGKVSKQEVLDFINQNGVQVEQVVLGNGSSEYGLNWSEQEFVKLSDHDQRTYEYAVDDEVENTVNGDREYAQEQIDEIKEKLKADHTDEDGNVNDEALTEAAEEKFIEQARTNAEEYVDTEDYYGAIFVVEEKNSGAKLEGNDERGWYSEDTGKHYNNLDEAKIQLAQHLIEDGQVEATSKDFYRPSDIEWRRTQAKMPTNATIKKKVKALVLKDKVRFEKQAFEQYSYAEKDAKELKSAEFKKELAGDVERFAQEEIEALYEDPNNKKNTLTVEIQNHGLTGTITGNNVTGYQFNFESETVTNNRHDLAAKDLESAKKEAVDLLVKGEVISPERTSGSDVNTPTGRTKFSRFSVDGGENYREVLLTLPKNKGDTFRYDTHFNEDNVLAHVRLTDRTDSEGRKVLYVEELQSDWHQQGREQGYSVADDKKQKIKEIEDKIDQLPETLNFNDWMAENHPDIKKAQVDDIWHAQGGKEFDDWKLHNSQIESTKNDLSDQRKALKETVPDAPFKNTEAWAALAMKRIIRLAVEQGYDAVGITPSSVHVERWGTDHVSWVKKDDGWLVGSVEQRGGNADGMDIEEVARQRGELLEKQGEKVTTKEELKKVVAETLNRERNDRSLDSLTDNIWNQMQTKESGIKEPRKEGMQFFYDNVLPKKVLPAILKKLDKDAKVSVADITTDSEPLKSWEIVLTPAMKEKAKEGMSLFQGDQSKPQGQIRFGAARQFNIDLFESADKSTFLHESGHFFLEVMADMATQEGAPAEVKQDYQTLLDWFGVKSREEITTAHHEQMARGFEAYLLEGKAPTSELRKAFNTFKNWLIDIYKSALSLDVNVTPEVREVFDRLLATQEQIDAAQGKMGGAKMFGDPRSAGMTEAETYEYLNAATFARMSAEEKLNEMLMRDLVRKQDAKYKAAFESIYAEELARAEQMPEFKAIAQIQGEFKLSTGVIEKSYPSFKQYLPHGSTLVDGGHHPDFVADMLGFENGQAMLQAIAPYRRGIKDFVTTQTVTELKIKYPELLESPELSDEALKAAHNENARKLKRMELEFLAKDDPKVVKTVAKSLIKRVPKDMAVKEQAAKIIGNKTVKELKPHIYLASERKYAKEASQHYLKGDFEAAFEAKRLEYLNFELYMAAQLAKEDVKKQVKNFKKLFQSDTDVARSRDVDLVNAGRAILSEFGITRAEKTAAEYLDKMKAYDPDTYATVSALVESSIENAADYQSVSYDKFKDMADSVMALWDLAKSHKEIEIEGKKMDADEVKAEMAVRLVEISDGNEPPGYSKKATDWDKVKMGLLGIKSALRRVESWADAVDGAKNIFKKYMFNPISEAAATYRVEKKKYIMKYLDIVKAVEKSLTQDKISAPELGYTFTGKAELLGALLHTGNESNLRKLLVGRGWGSVDPDGVLDKSKWNRFITRMHAEGALAKVDYDFAQGIWDLLEEMKPDAQKAHKKMYGFYFNEITANAITTPYGEYRGGYVPAVADQFMAQDAAIRNEKEQLEKMGNSFMFPTTGRGFTKSRVDAYAAPLSMDLSFVPGHIDKALRFIHIEPRVKEVSRIIMDKAFRKQLDAFDPTVGGDMLVPWLQRAAQQKISVSTQGWGGKAMDTFFRELRSRTSLQIMTLNVVNAMQQFGGLAIASTKVRPKYLRNALWQYIKQPKITSGMVSEKSKFMETRNTTSVIEIQSDIDDMLLNPTKYDAVRDYAKRHSQVLAAMTQNIVDNITWSGSYDQSIEEGMTEDQAVRVADSAVRLTQGSFNAEDVSRFETGSPFMRAFTMFYSYFNMQANLLGTEFTKISRDLGLRKGAGRGLYVYTMAFMVPAVLAEVIMQAMSGRGFDDDDDDNYLDDAMAIFFGSQFRSAAAMAPLVGQTANTAINFFNNKSYDDRISGSPAISIIENAVRTPHSVYKAIAENGSSKKAIKDSLTLIGMTLGVPAAPLGKPLGYLSDVQSGDVQPSGPIDFGRGLITGKGQTN